MSKLHYKTEPKIRTRDTCIFKGDAEVCKCLSVDRCIPEMCRFYKTQDMRAESLHNARNGSRMPIVREDGRKGEPSIC